MRAYGALVVLAIVWGTLTFGAVYPWTYWPLGVACAGLGVAGLLQRGAATGGSAGCRLGPEPWLALFACGVLVQLVPLPREWLLTVGPSTDAFLARHSLGYALDPPAWHPLSIAPAGTWIGFWLFVALSLFLVGASRALRVTDLEVLVRRLMLFGVLMALFGIVQKTLHGDAHDSLIYGFWQPRQHGNPFGPFVNRNHFAGWMLLVLPLTLGYAIGLIERARPARGRWAEWVRWIGRPEAGPFALATFAVLAMGTALALTGSRSGIAGFAGAVVVAALFVLPVLTRRSGGRLLAVYAATLLLVAITWAGVDTIVQRFAMAPGDLERRLAAWRDTAHIVRDFPLFGSGLNTYGTAMLLYQTEGRPTFYREAHNDYLQLAAEGGLLLGLPAVMALGLFVRDVRRRFRDGDDDTMTHWIRAGAVASLAAIGSQSLVDFSLQMPANAALFSLVAAIAVHKRPRRDRAPGL